MYEVREEKRRVTEKGKRVWKTELAFDRYEQDRMIKEGRKE